MISNDGHSNSYFGQAAVYRTAAELLLRGIHVSFPAVDVGFDLIAGGLVRIQVKATRLYQRVPHIDPYYRFALHSHKLANVGSVRKYVPKKAHLQKRADFVVLYGLDENRFWVVPTELLNGRSHVELNRAVVKSAWIDVDVHALEAARAEGLSFKAIGERFGVNEQIVASRLRGSTKGQQESKNRPVAAKVMRTENRWDLISNFIDRRTGPDEVSSVLQRIEQETSTGE